MGRSHECDHPLEVEVLPALTSARLGPLPTSQAIDGAVRDALKDALAIYDIDVAGLRESSARRHRHPGPLRRLCRLDGRRADRRGPPRDEGRERRQSSSHAPRRHLGRHPASRGRDPGRGPAGERLVASLKRRVEAIAERSRRLAPRPSVLSIEWIERPRWSAACGCPELVTLAGGGPLVTEPGQHAPTLTHEQLAALDPDVVLVKPCGFTLERTLGELGALPRVLPWTSWRAVAEARVYVAETGTRSSIGPALGSSESLEILAACVHPGEFEDFAKPRIDRASLVRIGRDLAPR